MLVGEDSHAGLSLGVRGGCLSSPAAQFKGFVSPGGGFRGQRKLILELPVWETSPLLAHPPDLWCREMSASSETDTIHVMNHQTSLRTTEAESVRKNNIYYVPDSTLSSRLINRASTSLYLYDEICRFNY